jgi:hypothetical protein
LKLALGLEEAKRARLLITEEAITARQRLAARAGSKDVRSASPSRNPKKAGRTKSAKKSASKSTKSKTSRKAPVKKTTARKPPATKRVSKSKG